MAGNDTRLPRHLDSDAFEAVRKAYNDYLLDGQNDHRLNSADARSRAQRFELGSPAEIDKAALEAAANRHIELSHAGASLCDANEAAREAFHAQKAQELRDLERARGNPVRGKATEALESCSAEPREQEAKQKLEAARPESDLAPKEQGTATGDRMAGRDQETEMVDVDRFRSDPEYRREVKDRAKQEVLQRRQADRPRVLERDERYR